MVSRQDKRTEDTPVLHHHFPLHPPLLLLPFSTSYSSPYSQMHVSDVYTIEEKVRKKKEIGQSVRTRQEKTCKNKSADLIGPNE